jgi:hypothetical protein
MRIFWGLLVVAAGAFMSISGLLKSNFIVYRLLVARSKFLWGDKVHFFYAIIGVLIIVFGIMMAVGVIGKG